MTFRLIVFCTELRADLFNEISDGVFNERERDVKAFFTVKHDTPRPTQNQVLPVSGLLP